jgi:L-iditol 2-dehydrogenase
VNVEEEDPAEVVRELTGGRGADLVVETSGAEPAIRGSVELVRPRGRISAIGIPKRETVAFPWSAAMRKVLDVRFNMSSSYTSWDRAISLLAGTERDIGQLITHRTSIERWEEVFHDLEAERGIKALFIPGRE